MERTVLMAKKKTLYHGSPFRLKTLKPRKPRGRTDYQRQEAVFMTDNKDAAALYALARDKKRKNRGWATLKGRLQLDSSRAKLNKSGYVYQVNSTEYMTPPKGDEAAGYAVLSKVSPTKRIKVYAKDYEHLIDRFNTKKEFREHVKSLIKTAGYRGSILMNVHDYIEKNAGLRSFLRDVSGRSLRKARKRAAASEVSLNKARDVYEDQMRSFKKTRDKIDPEDFMRAKQDYRSYVELNNDARKAIRMHNAGKSRSEIAESTKWKWLGRDPNLARGALKDSTEYIQDAKPKLKQMAFDMKEYNKARKAAQKLHSEQSIIENAHADRRYQAQMARERQDKARERVRNFFRKQF